jgi:hypothetical protein
VADALDHSIRDAGLRLPVEHPQPLKGAPQRRQDTGAVGADADVCEHRTVYNRIADRKVSRVIALARELLARNAEHVAACRTVDGEPC